MPPELFFNQEPRPAKSKHGLLLLPVIIFAAIVISILFFTKYYKPTAPIQPVIAEQQKPMVKSTYTWKPDLQNIVPSITQKPDISAKGALAINLDSDDVYFAKDAIRKLPMASITKIMTAILVLENNKLDDIFTVSEKAAATGENSMGVLAGEKYTVNELLWGLFLHSGNDAAETIAENVAGSRQAFIDQMNKRASELGAENTHFTNPSGLEGDGAMYTTAQDLAILSKYLVTNYPQVLDIAKTIDHTIPVTANHHRIDLVGQIDLIRTYPGAIGLKTGFTDEAGRCIITITENNGQRMMVIVLGSVDRRVDAVKLLDYSYNILGMKIKHEPYW